MRSGKAKCNLAKANGPALLRSRWRDHLATGRPLPDETRANVTAIAPLIGERRIEGAIAIASVARSWTEGPILVGQDEGAPSVDDESASVLPNRLPGVNLHFIVRLGRSKKGLGISLEIGVAFESRMKCSSECRLLLNRGLPSFNGFVGDTLAAGPHRFDRKFI